MSRIDEIDQEILELMRERVKLAKPPASHEPNGLAVPTFPIGKMSVVGGNSLAELLLWTRALGWVGFRFSPQDAKTLHDCLVHWLKTGKIPALH